jgi:hypothetical protein
VDRKSCLQRSIPALYNIARRKSDTVEKVLSVVPLNISFRRQLIGNNLVLWHNLVHRIMNVWLNNHKDVFRWNLHQNREFSVHSMYLALISNGLIIRNTLIWKLKIPLKIKIFMWYIYKEVVLTKDNLAKRKWNEGKQCCFCHDNETIMHLFFECHYAKFMWDLLYLAFNIVPPRSVRHMFGTWLNQFGGKLKRQALVGAWAFCWTLWLSKNDVVFDKSPIKSFMQVLYRGTHWLQSWAQME